ncbi:MAG: hypothetical protein ABI999_15035 [Acidobacteriota bacterium]
MVRLYAVRGLTPSLRTRTNDDLIMTGDKVSEMLQAFRAFIGENQMMTHLVMMAVRLKLELDYQE